MNATRRSLKRAGLCFTLAMALLIVPPTVAQETTFDVAVVNKTSEHPFFGQGWPEGYTINGAQGATLTLERGVTYTFRMQSVPALHPFYLSTSSSGAGAGAISDGVEGNFASGNQTLTFTPTASTPDVIYYQCSSHDFMGGRINISSATSTDSDVEIPRILTLEQNYPNPFNPGTVIQFRISTSAEVSLRIYDLSGRQIAAHTAGVLSPGVHEFEWDGADAEGRPVPSGAYVYRISAGSERLERVMMLIR